MNIRSRKLAPVALSLVATTFVAASLVGFGAKLSPTNVVYLGCLGSSFNGSTSQPCSTFQRAGVSFTYEQNSDGSVTTKTSSSSPSFKTSNDILLEGSAVHSFGIPTTDPNGTVRKAYVLFERRAGCAADTFSTQTGWPARAVASADGALAKAYSNGLNATDSSTAGSYKKVHATMSASAASGGYYAVNVSTSTLRTHAKTNPPVGNASQGYAGAAVQSKLFPLSANVTTSPQYGTLTGSAPRAEINFAITRSDSVAEPVHTFVKAADGTTTIDGLGFPNVTLTFVLSQPGFLRQTSTRAVVGEQLRSTANTAVPQALAVELVFGDADGDNDIDSVDTGIVNGYVGKTSSDAEWYDVVPNSSLVAGYPILVKDLDENQDGQITSTDVNVALANVGRTL